MAAGSRSGGGRVAVIDTSIALFIYYRESPARLAEAVLGSLRSQGYRIVYPPVVESEVRGKDKRALTTLNSIASRLTLDVDPRSFASDVEQWIKRLGALCECHRKRHSPLYCGVDEGDVAVSLSTPRGAILVTGDRGQACFHAALREGKALLVPYTI